MEYFVKRMDVPDWDSVDRAELKDTGLGWSLPRCGLGPAVP